MSNLEKLPIEQEDRGLNPTHIAILVVMGWAVIALVFGIYFFVFRKHIVSTDPAAWGQFGDFIGGAANPILSFITLVLLAFTLGVQNRQLNISSRELELSRKELELTRQELQRSAHAQELSEKALKAQAESAFLSAKLSGINFLLSHCNSKIKFYESGHWMAGDPELRLLNEYREKEKLLLSKVDDIYNQILGDENGF